MFSNNTGKSTDNQEDDVLTLHFVTIKKGRGNISYKYTYTDNR